MDLNNHPQLGKIVGEYLKLQEGFEERFEDLRMFHAPSECYALVDKSNMREEDEFFENLGCTWQELFDAVVERCSYRTAHFLGI